MSILVDLRPEIEAELEAQASGEGIPLSEYVRRVLEQYVILVQPRLAASIPDERIRAFHQWLEHFPQYRTEPLPDTALDREFYYDRNPA